MKIAFSCGSGGPAYDWCPAHLAEGIGGSEQQVLLMARHLAALGHTVMVQNRCGSLAGDYDGVRYLSYTDPLPDVDVRIGWRNWHLLTERRAPVQILSCHDIPVGEHCPTREEIAGRALANIDRVWVLNAYQEGLYAAAGVPVERLFVGRIGVDAAAMERAEAAGVRRIPGRVIYCSHPHRGLHRLREMWPQIKARAPHATLAAFWWEPEHFLPPNDALGILPMRKVGPDELSRELLAAEIFGYPSVFGSEISPATTIAAQMAGAVPVVIIAGGMTETVRYGHRASWESFAVAVANALDDPDWQQSQRREMMAWARQTYAWPGVAERFAQTVQGWLTEATDATDATDATVEEITVCPAASF